MSFETDPEVQGEMEEQQDARLRQHWARKARRRSSDGKVFVGDSLSLRENGKVNLMMLKNGEAPRTLVFSSPSSLSLSLSLSLSPLLSLPLSPL